MSVSASTSPANPRDTARLVLEMDSNNNNNSGSNSGSQNNAGSGGATDKSGSSSNNNDKIDPNLKFVDDENVKMDSKKDHDGDEIMHEQDADAKPANDDDAAKNAGSAEERQQQQQDQQGPNADEGNEGSDKDKAAEGQPRETQGTVLSEEEAKKKQLFFSSLKDLTENISSTIAEISILIPKIYDQNSLFNSYSNFLINSNTFESYDSYIAKVEGISASGNDDDDASNPADPLHASHDPNDLLSLHQQARANRFYHKLYSPLPMIPGTRIPEIDLNNQAKTVKDVWDEWTMGYKNNPALQKLEKKYGTRWRRGRIAKSAQRRKKVIEFIESEFNRHKSVVSNPLTVVQDLENYRILKGKGLFWLYGALPDRLYDDAGRPVFQNVGDVADVNTEDAPNSKISKELENGTVIEQGSIDGAENNINENNIETEATESGKTDDDKIDDNLKAVDSNNTITNNSNTATTANTGYSNTSDKLSNRDVDPEKKEQRSTANDDIDIDQLNSSDKSKSILNEEEEDEEEEDDDDVNMPSVADVAAMASMSVEGEDDEHSLVDSAALAVAAQHVADQQRLRDREKSSAKSQNDNEEGDLNNYISTEDGLNENTDPALSKL